MNKPLSFMARCMNNPDRPARTEGPNKLRQERDLGRAELTARNRRPHKMHREQDSFFAELDRNGGAPDIDNCFSFDSTALNGAIFYHARGRL